MRSLSTAAGRTRTVASSPWRVLVPVLVAGVLSTGTACSSSPDAPTGAGLAASVARETPAAPAAAPAELSPVPPAGTVTVQPGPFTDRVRLEGLALADGQVSGTLDVVSDVSELLALEVQVDAYDATGALLGSARMVVDPAEAEEFNSTAGIQDLPVTVPATGASSAVVRIPVLVNE